MVDVNAAVLSHLRSIERSMVAVAASMSGLIDVLQGDIERAEQAPAPTLEPLARTEAIEFVLRGAGEPMSPVRIWAQLQAAGRSDPKTEVQVTTYDLWRRGRIDKVGRGQYVAKENRTEEMPALTWAGP